MVRSVWSWLLAGAVIVAAPGCSSIGHMWESDDEFREEPVSEQCDDCQSQLAGPNCQDCAAAQHPATRHEVAQAPAPAQAEGSDPEMASLRAQIEKMKADIARAKAQRGQPAAVAAAPMSEGQALASIGRINSQIAELETQKVDLEKRIGDLEEQRRVVAAGVGRGSSTVQISKKGEAGDAALQEEESRLRTALQKYNQQPGR